MKKLAFSRLDSDYNLFLSGGGSLVDSFDLDEAFLELSGGNILYIPVGLKRTFIGYDECVEWFVSMVKKHKKVKKISVWINLKNKTGFLNKFDSVYIGGASDTGRLHEILKDSGFYPELKKFIEKGGLVYGGSGGASVLGRSVILDISPEHIKYINDEQKFLAADLCHGYSVFTHFKPNKKYELKRYANMKILVLPEQGGVAINTRNGQMTYLGKTNGVVSFDRKITKISNGHTMNLV
ncbi:MAG: Type 1 glutamine amidotransferase-like domain-containing protein [bacterium]